MTFAAIASLAGTRIIEPTVHTTDEGGEDMINGATSLTTVGARIGSKDRPIRLLVRLPAHEDKYNTLLIIWQGHMKLGRHLPTILGRF